MQPSYTQGTSIEVLAPYLPYAIEVKRTTDREVCIMVGLDGDNHYLSGYSRGNRNNHRYWPLKKCLPLLRPFSALRDPLPDGTVPAVEIAKLATWIPAELDQPNYDWASATAEHDEDEFGNEYIAVQVVDGDITELLYIFSHWDIAVTTFSYSNQAAIFKYLYSKHFAVGLQPNQFIVK